MNIPTRKKGQGAFEYILLLAGILLIVVLVIVILKGGLLTETQSNVQGSSSVAQANARVNCLNWCGQGSWTYLNGASLGNRTNCTDTLLLTGNVSDSNWQGCHYDPATGDTQTCNATYFTGGTADVPPQNARACSFFAGSTT